VGEKELFKQDLEDSHKGAIARVDGTTKAGLQRAAIYKAQKDEESKFLEKNGEDKLVDRVAVATVKLLIPYLTQMFEKVQSTSVNLAKSDEDIMSRLTGAVGKGGGSVAEGVGGASPALLSLLHKPGSDSNRQDLTNTPFDLENLVPPGEEDGDVFDSGFNDPANWGLSCDANARSGPALQQAGTKAKAAKKGKGKGGSQLPPVPMFSAVDKQTPSLKNNNAVMILGMANPEPKRFIQTFLHEYAQEVASVVPYHDKYCEMFMKQNIKTNADKCIQFIDLDPAEHMVPTPEPLLQDLYPLETQKAKQSKIVSTRVLATLLKLDLDKPKDEFVNLLLWSRSEDKRKMTHQSGAPHITFFEHPTYALG
jgi:hypothetical protein